MIRIFLVLLSISSAIFALNDIRLESKIVSGELFPVISINGRSVMMIEDRGDASRYVSIFERAEAISMVLKSLDQKGLSLSSIRVRRIKSEYFADLNGHRIFTIYPADRISHQLSSYQLAKLWTGAIHDAVDSASVSSAPVLDSQLETDTINYRYALLTGVQLLVIVGIQCVFAMAFLWYIDRYRVGHYRRLQQQLVQMESRCLQLESAMAKLDQNRVPSESPARRDSSLLNVS